MAKRAVIRIPVDMLRKLIGLPEDVDVLHIVIANYGMELDLVVTSPDMADTEVEIGCQPPTARPLFEVSDNGVRIVEVDYPREAAADPTAMTEVPPEFYDELVASFDEPPERNERVTQAARLLNDVVDRRGDEEVPA